MTKEIIGDACAFIRGVGGEKNRYPRIGIAMRDGERISIKLDALPIDKAWEGWINVFPRNDNARPLSANNPRATAPSKFTDPLKRHSIDDFDDDIPF